MGELKKNISYNLAFRIISIILPLITAPYLSRVLGAEQMGVFVYTNSIAYYFFLFSMLGVNLYGNREIAIASGNKETLSRIFWQIYYIQFFLTILLAVFYFIIVKFVIKPSEDFLIWIIQGLYVISAMTDINWFAFGLQKFKLTTIRSTIIKILTVASYFIFVHKPEDLWRYAFIVQFGNIISLLVIWTLVFRETKFEAPIYKDISKHLKNDFLLFLPLVASSLYQYMDKIMLGVFGSKAEVGFYTYAENILNIPIALITAMSTVLLPYVSKLIAEDKVFENFSLIYRSIDYLSALTIGMAFGVVSIAEEFIPFYLGKEYIRSAHILIFLSPMIVVSGMNEMIRTQYLIPRKMDKKYLLSITIGAIINIILNSFLIPAYKANGAAMATVAAYVSVLIAQYFFSRKDINYINILKGILPYILFGIIMFILLRGIDFLNISNVILSVVVKVFIGTIFYTLLCGAWMLIVKKDSYILSIINRHKK